MKTIVKNTIVSLLLAVGMVQLAVAQTYSGDKKNTNGDNIVLQGQDVNPAMLASLGLLTAANPKNATLQGNSVFLRQVGDYNTASIFTNTSASEINLTQNGNSNDAQLNYTANTAVADLVQNGDFNKIKDYVNLPGADISLDLTQNGDGLNFQRQGVNDLTKSLKFRQTEGTPSLIIRSTN